MNDNQQYKKMNRHEKIEFLRDTCAQELVDKTMYEELVCWIGEQDFEAFYEHFCSMWDICKDQDELNERYGE